MIPKRDVGRACEYLIGAYEVIAAVIGLYYAFSFSSSGAMRGVQFNYYAVGLCGTSAYAGIGLWRHKTSARTTSVVLQALQVPRIFGSTSLILLVGTELSIRIQPPNVFLHLENGVILLAGSALATPAGIGVNLVALISVIALWFTKRRSPDVSDRAL